MTLQPAAPRGTKTFRPEIQALRALAVGLVVVYHIWPPLLSGGFVGVDVFFVISGFLITSHLVSELDKRGKVSLASFWSRRIRRLLPAAFAVLLATLAITWLFLPETMWQQTMQETLASVFYVQNWVLAADSIDYLAAENDPSPVQHFWSLSVEEQFYIFLPLLLLLALTIARRLRSKEREGWHRRAIVVALSVVLVASMAASVLETLRSPASAYFVTTTRAWEFAAGGLLGSVQLRPSTMTGPRARAVGGWLGIFLILAAAILFDGHTAFPGYLALVPVVGAVLLLWAGYDEGAWAPSSVSRFGPFQWIGDHSYSIYLWHWPIVVAYPYIRGNQPELKGGLAIVATTLVLAWLTKRFVEDPVRTGAFWRAQRRRSFALAALGMACIAVLSGGASSAITQQQAKIAADLAAVEPCLGARSLDRGNCAELLTEQPITPSLAARSRDVGIQYECYVPKGSGFRTCSYGAESGRTRIALTGDSHAASYLPGLAAAAKELDATVDVYIGNGCALVAENTCAAHEEFNAALRNGNYDLVLATALRQGQPPELAIAPYWSQLMTDGMNLAVIGDVPHYPGATDSCVSGAPSEQDAAALCSTTRATALETYDDRFARVAESLGVPVLDPVPLMCNDETCPAVIGNTVVYRDSPASHITASFSETLDDFFVREIRPLIAG